jgi:hypothetical protein
LLCMSATAFSQNNNNNLPSNTDAFGKGTNVINVGIGLGGDYTYIGPGYSSSPNIIISYDNGTFDHVGPGIISLGGILSYKSASFDYSDYSYYYNNSWTYFILGFRSAYHWNFTSNSHFDPYAGLILGYYDISYKESSNAPGYNVVGSPYYYSTNYGSYVGLTVYIGARYYVSDHIGFWLELGYGYSNAALGLSIKF